MFDTHQVRRVAALSNDDVFGGAPVCINSAPQHLTLLSSLTMHLLLPVRLEQAKRMCVFALTERRRSSLRPSLSVRTCNSLAVMLMKKRESDLLVVFDAFDGKYGQLLRANDVCKLVGAIEEIVFPHVA